MSQRLKNILVVGCSTVGSRVLGLARDIAIAAVLGVSLASNAFFFAFAVPNLFRRLFGEGALSSAFIPALSSKQETEGSEAAFAFANQVFTWLTALLCGLLALGTFGYWLFLGWLKTAPVGYDAQMLTQWRYGAVMGIMLLPYMPLICLTAMLGAALNVNGRFTIPALSPILLNVCMLGALGLAWLLGAREPFLAALALGGGVLLGGWLQYFAAIWGLRRLGWRGKPDFRFGPDLRRLLVLFFPAVLAAAVLQINILVSRLLAFGLNETATTTLNLASRLVELPLGVFAIAIATVIFPEMSRHATRRDQQGFTRTFSQGQRLILALTLPAAAGLVALAEPILRLLFEWGRFSSADILLTVPLLQVAAAAIPLYALITLGTRALHAHQRMKAALGPAFLALGANLGLSLWLMGPFEATGLALANSLATLLQLIALQVVLKRVLPDDQPEPHWPELLKIAAATLGMTTLVLFAQHLVQPFFSEEKARALAVTLMGVPVGAGVYFALLWLLRFRERDEVIRLIKRFLKR